MSTAWFVNIYSYLCDLVSCLTYQLFNIFEFHAWSWGWRTMSYFVFFMMSVILVAFKVSASFLVCLKCQGVVYHFRSHVLFLYFLLLLGNSFEYGIGEWKVPGCICKSPNTEIMRICILPAIFAWFQHFLYHNMACWILRAFQSIKIGIVQISDL